MENEIKLDKLNMIDKFFIIWSFFIPITTIILIPSIKMTVLSIVFAYLSPIVIFYFFRKNKYKYMRNNYIKDILRFYFIFCFFIVISQFSNAIIDISLYNIPLSPSDESLSIHIFRYTLFVQTIYCLPAILTFYYTKHFYSNKWDKWIIRSGLLFALYALYKWAYYLIMGEDGDFLTNKVYDDSDKQEIGNSGTLFQGIYIGGLLIQRLQGLSGEPAMYAFTALPYFIFAIQKKANIFIIFILGISLLLTTSTSAYLGLLIYIMVLVFSNKLKKKYLILGVIGVVVFYIIFSDYINDIIKLMILEKIFNSANSQSGAERSSSIIDCLNYWGELDPIHMLFGIGYGYIRSFDFFTTLLVNVGILGLVIFCYFILKDIKLKNCDFVDIHDNAIIIVLFSVLMMSVAEIWFVSFWLFIGIIKNKKAKIDNKRVR